MKYSNSKKSIKCKITYQKTFIFQIKLLQFTRFYLLKACFWKEVGRTHRKNCDSVGVQSKNSRSIVKNIYSAEILQTLFLIFSWNRHVCKKGFKSVPKCFFRIKLSMYEEAINDIIIVNWCCGFSTCYSSFIPVIVCALLQLQLGVRICNSCINFFFFPSFKLAIVG